MREEVYILSTFPTRATLNLPLRALCDDAADAQLQPGVGRFKFCFCRTVQRWLRVRERAVRQMVLRGRTVAGSVWDRVFWKALLESCSRCTKRGEVLPDFKTRISKNLERLHGLDSESRFHSSLSGRGPPCSPGATLLLATGAQGVRDGHRLSCLMDAFLNQKKAPLKR